MYQELVDKKQKLAVIGLGYVGLPVALGFAKKLSVIGFDIFEKKIEQLREGKDPNLELDDNNFKDTDIYFTSDAGEIQEAIFYIVAVPTPVDEHKVPDLSALLSATEIVAKVLKKGDYVVYESTVYPGCTEEKCVPLLEKISGLKFKEEFKVGYSPERINPGDKEHILENIVKVVSGCDDESLELISKIYGLIIQAGVHNASSIKVAEAAKIIENVQRDVNIALMNELSMIFDTMQINTYDVLAAAGTKWNFLKFVPGLVGGHCIGVDPYYLTYKAKEMDYEPQVILAGRSINDQMGAHIARRTVQLISRKGKDVAKSRVLVMGATFKENVNDIRNSKVADIIHELKKYAVQVDVIDPMASSEDLEKEYGFSLIEKPGTDYDAIILAVSHDDYTGYDEEYFESLSNGSGILIDVKGIFKDKIKKLEYWSL
ncbi:MAG: nucleotide sugar dehydrogenase [Bacteroidetes bacterium]|nr:nucleotide sugar dehydrogenase [Bacteroidota bacterium]